MLERVASPRTALRSRSPGVKHVCWVKQQLDVDVADSDGVVPLQQGHDVQVQERVPGLRTTLDFSAAQYRVRQPTVRRPASGAASAPARSADATLLLQDYIRTTRRTPKKVLAYG